jgi:hypothetical protein
MQTARALLPSEGLDQADAGALRKMLEGFTGFFGGYEVDENAQTITHRVIGHVIPNSVGKELERSFEFNDNRLILRPSATRVVIWERATR